MKQISKQYLFELSGKALFLTGTFTLIKHKQKKRQFYQLPFFSLFESNYMVISFLFFEIDNHKLIIFFY